MPDFSFSARTRLDKSKERAYFRLRVDSADHAGDVAGLMDNLNTCGVKYQVSQITKEEKFTSLDKSKMTDYAPWYVQFHDSQHPDKKLKLTIPFCKKSMTSAEQLDFMNTFILKHVQFQDATERSAKIKAGEDPNTAPWYNANAYNVGGSRGKVRDVTTSDHSADEQTAPSDLGD